MENTGEYKFTCPRCGKVARLGEVTVGLAETATVDGVYKIDEGTAVPTGTSNVETFDPECNPSIAGYWCLACEEKVGDTLDELIDNGSLVLPGRKKITVAAGFNRLKAVVESLPEAALVYVDDRLHNLAIEENYVAFIDVRDDDPNREMPDSALLITTDADCKISFIMDGKAIEAIEVDLNDGCVPQRITFARKEPYVLITDH